jgi:hypothetical protein
MSSFWDSPVAAGSSASSSFDSNATPIPFSNTPAKSSLSTSPSNPSPLHQRKDDHAHRKRNRIVVCFVAKEPKIDDSYRAFNVEGGNLNAIDNFLAALARGEVPLMNVSIRSTIRGEWKIQES